jgi:hypothetical protein
MRCRTHRRCSFIALVDEVNNSHCNRESEVLIGGSGGNPVAAFTDITGNL